MDIGTRSIATYAEEIGRKVAEMTEAFLVDVTNGDMSKLEGYLLAQGPFEGGLHDGRVSQVVGFVPVDAPDPLTIEEMQARGYPCRRLEIVFKGFG